MDIRSLKIPRLGYMQNKEKGMREEYLGMYKDNAVLDSKELTEFSGKLLGEEELLFHFGQIKLSSFRKSFF